MSTAPDVSLWLLIGLPGSGKSTWARHFLQTAPAIAYISTDQIRGELFGNEATQGPWPQVWGQGTYQMREAVRQSQEGELHGALYDATNVRRRDRRRVMQTAQSLGFTRLLAVWFDVPLGICLQRNQGRSRQVPPAVIATMSRQLAGAPPQPEEGFAAIYRLS